jgi:hypothetical protein
VHFKSDMEALQWLFDTKTMGGIFKHIVDIEGTAQPLQELRRLSSSDGSAADVAAQLKALQACIGPPFLKELLSSGEFCEVCPRSQSSPPWPPLDDELTVRSNSRGQRVVAEYRGTHYAFLEK